MKFIITHKDFDNPNIDKSKYVIVAPDTVKITSSGWKDVLYFKDELDNRVWSEFPAMKFISTLPLSITDTVEINHYRRIFKDDIDYYKGNVVSNAVMLNTDNRNFYGLFHNIDDLDKVTSIISQVYPNYIDKWLYTLNQKFIHPYNMVRFDSSVYKDYINFIWNIMKHCEYDYESLLKNIYIPNGCRNTDPKYQARVPSFIIERISNLYYNILSGNSLIYVCEINKFDGAW